MSEMVGKMSVQEKIAELEARIAALEKGRMSYTTVTRTSATLPTVNPFGEHWHNMWDEFNLMMKDVFKRQP